MKKVTLLLFFITFNNFGYAQNIFGLSVNVGTITGVSTNLPNLPATGPRLSVGPRINILNERIYVKPTGGLFLLSTQANDSFVEDESLTSLCANLEILGRIGEYEKVQFYPFITVGLNSVLLNLDKVGSVESETAISGWGYFYGVGLVIEYKSFQLKSEYNILFSQSRLETVFMEGNTWSDNYDPKFYLGTISFTLGYTFARK